MDHQGVIIGCDQKQEWLLPWWWDHYSQHNSHPVACFDFGMSPKGIAWCREKGQHIKLNESVALDDQTIPCTQKEKWENRMGKGFWSVRSAWFKKPLTLLQSPFDISLWIDLDCQINGSLEPLFNSLLFGGEIGLVKEPHFLTTELKDNGFLMQDALNFNSGVIVFRKQTNILHQWAMEAIEHHAQHIGDQDALNHALLNHQSHIIELPIEYNWIRHLGPNKKALIYHFTGSPGKIKILKAVKSDRDPLIGALLPQEYIDL
ncbi:MAG: hypothetical protein NTZ52_03390 [Chlamydiae bacterium]|nr:hypothetical protein [Chlamydiota bacterium]